MRERVLRAAVGFLLFDIVRAACPPAAGERNAAPEKLSAVLAGRQGENGRTWDPGEWATAKPAPTGSLGPGELTA